MLLLLLCGCAPARVFAQLPFYTEDPAVTDRGTFEFFDEFDALQFSQYPNLRQNTINFKLNYGLPHRLEVDLDAPYLSILRAVQVQDANGAGDRNFGMKWNFRGLTQRSHAPALAASLYIELPTGNEREQLGSGLADYWLNFNAQEPLTKKTRIAPNLGFLFAGNTSMGVIGIETRRKR